MLPCIIDRVLVDFEEDAGGRSALSDCSLEETFTLWRQVLVDHAHRARTFPENRHLGTILFINTFSLILTYHALSKIFNSSNNVRNNI